MSVSALLQASPHHVHQAQVQAQAVSSAKQAAPTTAQTVSQAPKDADGDHDGTPATARPSFSAQAAIANITKGA